MLISKAGEKGETWRQNYSSSPARFSIWQGNCPYNLCHYSPERLDLQVKNGNIGGVFYFLYIISRNQKELLFPKTKASLINFLNYLLLPELG